MKKIKFLLLIVLLFNIFSPTYSYAKAKPTAEAYYKSASNFYNLGKYQDAIKNYDSAIKLNQKYVQAYLGKGNALFKLNKYKEAILCYDKVIQLNPKDPQAYYFKGKTLLSIKLYAEALKYYDKAISLNYKNSDIYFEKGEALYSLNKYEDALSAYSSSIELNKNNAQAFLKMGDILYSQKKYEDALKQYNSYISLNPSNSYAYYSKGAALHYLGRYLEAIAAYDKSLSIEKNYVDAYVNKADSLANLKRYSEAMLCLDKADQINPKNIDSFISRGNIYYFQNMYEEAIKYYDTAISINSSAENAYTGKGYSLYYLNKFTDSIDCFNKALNLSPNDADLNYYMSLALFKSGDTKNYISYLQKAIFINESYISKARTEDAFKNLASDDIFLQTVYDATDIIKMQFDEADTFKEGIFSDIKFLDLKTLGDDNEDKKLIQVHRNFIENFYTGKIYNKNSLDIYHINKNTPLLDKIIKLGRDVKKYILIGLKFTYSISEENILYVSKQSGKNKAAIIHFKYNLKVDGESTEINDSVIYMNNNDIWEFCGFLDNNNFE